MKPLPRIVSVLSAALIIAAAIGFLDAAYLAAKYFTGGPIACSVLDGCDTVTKSAYAVPAGIPVAVLGVMFYASVLVLALVFRERRSVTIARLLAIAGAIGFLASVWLVSVQVFILDALCLYCILSAGSSTAIFILGIAVWRLAVARANASDAAGHDSTAGRLPAVGNK
ncbi:vitamin K epoxide reductase family protein [Candidatus Parcubacteria bacterium]|nr:MAG: vitamin K epoxide reductase family protein [Candidatus Parcubacteria bacterium]